MPTMEEKAKYYLVDKRGEGGLVSELDRVAMADQPTLIIGLGGTGGDALKNVKYVMRRKLKRPEGKTKPDRLEYLAIDTDTDDLKKAGVGGVFLEDNEIADVTEKNLIYYMKNPDQIPQVYQREWLSRGFTVDFIEKGAGGIRQCGRLMLMLRAEAIINRIRQKVEAVWAGHKENGAGFVRGADIVNVYILTGISGGTGSGTFLDIAYLTRYVVERICGYSARVRGVIFMPDVNLCKVTEQRVRDYIPVNGYAALKELDFWMNPQRGRNFTQRYTASVAVDSPEAPFDLCFMVSPNCAAEEDYPNCMRVTGEALLNILSAAQDQANGDNAQNFEGFVTNLQQMMVGAAASRRYAGNYVFASMGMDERRLQMDQMANLIAYYLLGRVMDMLERKPTDAEVEKIFKDLQLDSRKGMRDLFDSDAPRAQFENPVRTLNDLKATIARYNHGEVLDRDQLEEEFKAWVAAGQSHYGTRRNAVRDKIIANLKMRLEKLFTDLKFGPFYAHKVLHNTEVGKKDLLEMLKAERDQISSYLMTVGKTTENLKNACADKLETARKSKFVPIMNNSTYNDYVEAAFKYYDHLRYVALCNELGSLYDQLIDEATKYNNDIVESFVTLLSELNNVFAANSDIMARVETTGNVHSWNIGNFDRIAKKVQEAFATLDNQGLTNALVTEFLQLMLDDSDAWVGDRGDLGESFSKFVSDKFGELMKITLEESFKQMNGLTSDQQLIDYIQTSVLPTMQSRAHVLYSTDSTMAPMDEAPHKGMISYPADATNIAAAVTEYIRQNPDIARGVPSLRSGSLFWFQASFGLPLFAHPSVDLYQTLYKQAGNIDFHSGRHLKMGVDENWLELLPPLLPEAIWSIVQYTDRPRAEHNQKARELVREAWRNLKGVIIQPKIGGEGKYLLGVADKAEYDGVMAGNPFTEEEVKLLIEQGAAAATSMKKDMKQVSAFRKSAQEFLAGGWRQSPTGQLQFKNDSFNLLMGGEIVADQDDNPDLRMEQLLSENILLTPDMYTKLAEQMALYRAMKDAVDACQAYAEVGNLEANMRRLFVKAWCLGLYRKLPGSKAYQLNTEGEGLKSFPLMLMSDYEAYPAEDPFYARYRKFLTLKPEENKVIATIVTRKEKKIDTDTMNGDATLANERSERAKKLDEHITARLDVINMALDYEHPEIAEFYEAVKADIKVYLVSDEEDDF